MGVPVGHPFFGNQYTNGGYVSGSYKYAPEGGEIVEKVVVCSSELISENIDKTKPKIVTRDETKKIIQKGVNIRGLNKNTLIAIGISGVVATISGYFAYKHIRKKIKAKKDELQSIELINVGICIQCAEPLNGSTYVPENESNSQKAYIICKKCGEKNFAWYPREKELTE